MAKPKRVPMSVTEVLEGATPVDLDHAEWSARVMRTWFGHLEEALESHKIAKARNRGELQNLPVYKIRGATFLNRRALSRTLELHSTVGLALGVLESWVKELQAPMAV